MSVRSVSKRINDIVKGGKKELDSFYDKCENVKKKYHIHTKDYTPINIYYKDVRISA